MLKSIHRAKYVLAEPELLLSNAAVHISDPGRIVRIEPWHDPPAIPGIEIVDWGNAVIMPGLINAHAHLELTALYGQLTTFSSFTDWIAQLIDRRRLWTREQFLDSARAGAHAALTSGTTLVGDVTSSGFAWEAACGTDLRHVVFQEAIGLDPADADQVLSQIQSMLDGTSPNPLLMPGLSPHAPYSVSPELYRRLAGMARSRRLLLATHIAETKAEIQFLETGTGEFKDFLSGRGILPDHWRYPELAPIAYLDSLGVLGQSCILIHCNYLDEESIRRILRTRSSVVYCPRSHNFFGHDTHPVRKLLDSGINVALGTDSLASNSSLSMLDEMRFLYNARKDIKPEEIFRAATLNGAAALSFGGFLGRLRRGYWADLTVLEIPEGLGSRLLLTHMLEGAGECVATIIQGKVAWSKQSSRQPPVGSEHTCRT
jgi:cytosine/adenosine deaminase-related metal-dependent hydrolase